MATLNKQTMTRYADGIYDHLVFHSSYLPAPQGYQFRVADDCIVVIHDLVLRNRRTLVFYSVERISRGRVISQMLGRPRRAGNDGPWFVGDSDRVQKRTRKALQRAVERSFGLRDNDPAPGIPVLDALSAPTTMPGVGTAPRVTGEGAS